MARGVQGMIDLTVPGGGCSLSVVVVGAGAADGMTDERRDCGSMKRMLKRIEPVSDVYYFFRMDCLTCDTSCNGT